MTLRRDCSFPLFVFEPGTEQVTGKYSDFVVNLHFGKTSRYA